MLPPSSSSKPIRLLRAIILGIAIISPSILVQSKEIIPTHEWQLLSEDDTIPAGLHVRMDLSTGEKWAKLPTDDKRDEGIRAAIHHDGDNYGIGGAGVRDGNEGPISVEIDSGSGAVRFVGADDDGATTAGDDDNDEGQGQVKGGAGARKRVKMQ
ncbi:hypothetical protein ACHAXR_002524 [Thalassiosira sp. AJA248-18]